MKFTRAAELRLIEIGLQTIVDKALSAVKKPVAEKAPKRKKMTPAQRKAVGQRMRKYWKAKKSAKQ